MNNDMPEIPESTRTPYAWRLMAERTNGTDRMIYDLGDDKEYLETRARRMTSRRTRYWVESNADTLGTARDLYWTWKRALNRYRADPQSSIELYTAEERAHEMSVDFVEQYDLVGSEWDPRGPILGCGCPKQIVDDCGHQEGCELAVDH